MQNKKAFLIALASYLPEKIFSNQDIAKEYPKWSSESVLEKIGIEQRHISADEEFISDMAVKAAEKLFANNPEIRKEEIDFVILCTQSSDFTIPTTACIIQNELGLNKNIGAFDFNLGCSGFVYGLGISKGLICSSQAKNILLITAEAYSKRMHPEDFKNRSLFGDAAVAILISEFQSDNAAEILEFSYGTDGSDYDKLIHFNSGNNFPGKEEKFSIKYEESNFGNDFLYMDGKAIFEFSLTQIPSLIKKTLQKNGIEKEGIDLFVMHQANKFMLEAIKKRAKIEDDKFYISMRNVGNTVSSTIPLALIDAMKEKKISKGEKVLIAGFGVGLSLAGCVLKF